jgi:hypothetical protein
MIQIKFNCIFKVKKDVNKTAGKEKLIIIFLISTIESALRKLFLLSKYPKISRINIGATFGPISKYEFPICSPPISYFKL